MKNIIKNNKGYSLIELMVVVGIVGVLAGIGIPVYTNYRAEAVFLKHKTNVQQLYNAKLTLETRGQTTFTSADLARMVKGVKDTEIVISINSTNSDQWCIGYTEGSTSALSAGDVDACIDQENSTKISGEDAPCSNYDGANNKTNCTGATGCTHDNGTDNTDNTADDKCTGRYTQTASCTTAGLCQW